MNVWGQVRVFSFCIWGNSNGQIGPIRKSWENCGHYSFDDSNDFKNGNDHSFDSFEKGGQLYEVQTAVSLCIIRFMLNPLRRRSSLLFSINWAVEPLKWKCRTEVMDRAILKTAQNVNIEAGIKTVINVHLLALGYYFTALCFTRLYSSQVLNELYSKM